MIIDFHTHTFPDTIAARAVQKLASQAHEIPKCDGTNKGLLAHMEQSGVDVSVLVPIATKPEQTYGINELAYQTNSTQSKLISFGSVHPLNDDYKHILRDLKAHNIKGIKLHPAYQNMYFDDTAYLRLISYAQEMGLFVLVHAGMDAGLPGCDYASISHIIPALDTLDQSKLILAHMGGYGEWESVEQYIAGSNVYFDTSYSPLPNEQFARIIKKHGTDKILFGTDSPWTNQKTAVDNILSLGLSTAENNQILYENASKILKDAITM